MLAARPADAAQSMGQIRQDDLCRDEVSAWLFGEALSATGDYQGAVRQWACGPHTPRKYLSEGDRLYGEGDLAGSAAAYQAALDIGARQRNLNYESAGYIGLARVAVAQKRWDQAIASGRKATELTPHDADAVASLAHTLSIAGQTVEARLVANRSLALGPNWLADLVLGELAYKAGQLDQAAAYYATAADLRPDDPWAWYWLGVISGRKGDKAAEARYRAQAATLAPSFGEVGGVSEENR